MAIDITIKIGGEAGQGIQTVGQLLALTCREAGLHVFGINDFESRIRGGHSFFQIRISDVPVRAPHHRVHMLIALDDNTVNLHSTQVVSDGLIIVNKENKAAEKNILAIPFFSLAQKAGDSITANTVATGAALALLGAPFELFSSVLKTQFTGKDPKIKEQNLTAAKLGYDAIGLKRSSFAFTWSLQKNKRRLVEGAQAIALGALAGDCRFVSFYPMSPATGIMLQLAALQDKFPLVVEQAEDEIAAVNMIIGASFAGVRSMTATSGGGFCLMTEGVGLAGITETPIVVINAQRPGPATGLATRTEQADLQFVIRAAQDDFPRFVFAPSSPEEGFVMTARGLHLAEKYQVPVIILVDQYLNDSLYTCDNTFTVSEKIERFIYDGDLAESPSSYKRYALTSSGISPRALPCKSRALVKSCGNEHREDGHTSEAIEDRNSMVQKRTRKMDGMLTEMRPPLAYHGDAQTLLVGWGSIAGILREAIDLLRQDGIDIGLLHFSDIWPFPAQAVTEALATAGNFFVVEQNSNAQFSQLIRQETGRTASGNILKYDGRPFYPIEVINSVKEKMR